MTVESLRFEQQFNEKIQNYEDKISFFREKAHSIDPGDEIHALIRDLEEQNSLMKKKLEKMKQSDEETQKELKQGITDANDFFNTVIDKVARRIV